MSEMVTVWAVPYLQDAPLRVRTLDFVCASPHGVLIPQPSDAETETYISRHPSFAQIKISMAEAVTLGVVNAPAPKPEPEVEAEPAPTPDELFRMKMPKLRAYAKSLGIDTRTLKTKNKMLEAIDAFFEE